MKEMTKVLFGACAGLALGGMVAYTVKEQNQELAYDRGHADGLDACKGPTRLERAAKWVAQ